MDLFEFYNKFCMELILNNYSKNQNITLCMLGNFACFCRLLIFFFKINVFKTFSQKHHQSTNRMDQDQAETFVHFSRGHYENHFCYFLNLVQEMSFKDFYFISGIHLFSRAKPFVQFW